MLRKAVVENGILQGVPSGDPRITVFKGVPYAKAPLGELRWKNPQPAENWEGVRMADKFPDLAMMYEHPGVVQTNFYTRELHPASADYPMSEDCLYLNVWTPAKSADEKLPVLFYIHGGGFTAGYSYEMEFDGERVARKGVIMVTVSYRLGIFGFFAHPELSAEDENAPKGNYGVMDQMYALQWVKRNIAAFGGDPDQIVIAGQSAGAASVQCQLASPMTEGLFQGAIIQSSVSPKFCDLPLERSKSLKAAEQEGVEIFEKLGISSLEEARKMDSYELLNRVLEAYPGRLRASPVVDGIYLKEDASDAYMNGNYHDVPILYGHNLGEAISGVFRLGPEPPKNIDEFNEYVKVFGEKEQEYRDIVKVKTDEDVKALFDSLEYNRMYAGTFLFGHQAVEKGRRVYQYLFDAPIPGEDDPGSYHGAELWFMFDSLSRNWRPFTGLHYDLARKVNGYWVNFVKTGDPNGETWQGEQLPEWKPFDTENKWVMKFVTDPELIKAEESDLLKFRIDYTMEQMRKANG